MIMTITLAPTFDLTYHLDKVEMHEINRVKSKHIEPSGKGINVSINLAEEGHKTTAIAPIPDSPLGNLWIEMAEEKFDVRTSETSKEIRINTSVVDAQAVTKLNEKAAELADAEIVDLVKVVRTEAQATKPEWIALCGSVHTSNADRIGQELKKVVDETGAKFAVDCSGDAFNTLLGYKPDFIKPNRDELKELYPEMNDSKESYIDHVKQLARRIDGTVLCTDGAKVAYATNQIDLLEIVPPTIAGANNVGAGDASLAGYLAAESSGSDFATAISTAMSWASAACQNPGTAGLNLKAAKGAAATITTLS